MRSRYVNTLPDKEVEKVLLDENLLESKLHRLMLKLGRPHGCKLSACFLRYIILVQGWSKSFVDMLP